MENLILKGSEKTPHFALRCDGDISFGGISMPEDAATFYFDIMDWLSDYYREPSVETLVTVSFRYLNSSSSSMILKIFHLLNRLHSSGKTDVKCIWYYEDTDENMLNYIERIQALADNIEFRIHPTDNILSA
jgi:hypothetical protein